MQIECRPGKQTVPFHAEQIFPYRLLRIPGLLRKFPDCNILPISDHLPVFFKPLQSVPAFPPSARQHTTSRGSCCTQSKSCLSCCQQRRLAGKDPSSRRHAQGKHAEYSDAAIPRHHPDDIRHLAGRPVREICPGRHRSACCRLSASHLLPVGESLSGPVYPQIKLRGHPGYRLLHVPAQVGEIARPDCFRHRVTDIAGGLSGLIDQLL